MDLYDIPTPTRITTWLANVSTPESDPTPSTYKDPYGMTPYEYWTNEDWALFKKDHGRTKKYKKLIEKYFGTYVGPNDFVIIITYPCGTTKEYNSFVEASKYSGISDSTLKRWAYGECKTREGYKIEKVWRMA